MLGRPPSHLGRAIPAVLFACFIYAILSVVVKEELLYFSVPGILFWRYAISIVLFIPWMLYQTRGKSLELRPKSFRFYWIRAGGSLASVYLYSLSLETLSVSLASLLFNLLPLFVPLVAYVWRKVPINHALWWGFITALIGVGLVLSPQNIEWNKGMLFAVASGICGAFAIVSLRLAHYEDPPYLINFYFFLLAWTIVIPTTFLDIHESWGALSARHLIALFIIGATGFLYQQSFSFALKNAPARLLAPFMYSTVIWGVIFDHLLWGAVFTSLMWMGTGLIIVGNILIYLLYPKKEI